MHMPRRLLLSSAAATAVGAALASCAPASKDASASAAADSDKPAKPEDADVKGTVRVHVGGDTNVRDMWQQIIQPAFTKKHPQASLEIQHDLHSERSQQVLAKLSAAGKGDAGIDFIDDGLVLDAAKSQLLAPLDTSNVPGIAKIAAQQTLEVGKGQAFPYRASSVLLAYAPAAVPNPPKTLNELLDWIVANPGKFAYNSPSTGGSGQAFVTSVLDLYVDKKVRTRMETGSEPEDEKQWDKGFEKLKELGPSMYQGGVYPNGNSQVLDLLSSGQIVMAPVWSDQFLSGQKSGQIPAEIHARQISDPPFTGSASYLGIPRHTKAMAPALALADLILSPEVQTEISKVMAGYPVLPMSDMPQEVQDTFKDADPDQLRNGYSSDHSKSMNELWDQKVPTQR